MKIKTCARFFNELVVFPDVISPCCSMFAQGPMFPFSGKTIPKQAYKKFLHEQFSLLQQGADICKGCPELTVLDDATEEVRTDFRVKTLHSTIYRGSCECRCVYCDDSPVPIKKQPISQAKSIRPILDSLLEQDLFAQYPTVTWGGGEPTLHKEFSSCVAMLRAYGIHQVFFTNAVRTMDAICETLQQEKGQAIISLDSGSRDIFKKIKRVDKFDAVLATIHAYSNAAKHRAVILKYILHEFNRSPDEIDAFFSICQDAKLASAYYSHDFATLRKGSIPEEILSSTIYFIKTAEKRGLAPIPYSIDITGFVQKHYTHYLREKAKTLAGKAVYFWGCGKQYSKYKNLFSACQPEAVLVSTMGRDLKASIDGVPLMHPAAVPSSAQKLPFVIFCEAGHAVQFNKQIRAHEHFCNGELIWCSQ